MLWLMFHAPQLQTVFVPVVLVHALVEAEHVAVPAVVVAATLIM